MNAREDAYCPACPDPETAFRLEDVGMKVVSEDLTGDSMHIRVTRPAWEVVMMEHLRSRDDEAHRRVYAQCVAILAAAKLTVEESVQREVQVVADWGRRVFDLPAGPPSPFPSAFTVFDHDTCPAVRAYLDRERPAR